MHVSLMKEEIAALLLLAGHGGRESAIGIVGSQTIDDPEFEIGTRALLSRGLAVMVDDGLKISNEALRVADILARPQYAGYCVVGDDQSLSPSLVCEREANTVVATQLGAGAFDIALVDIAIPDAVMRIGRFAAAEVGGDGWRAAVRFHSVDRDPVDLLFGEGSVALLRERTVTVVSDAEATAAVAEGLELLGS